MALLPAPLSPSIELLQWVFGEKRAFFSSFNFLLCSLQTPPNSYRASSASDWRCASSSSLPVLLALPETCAARGLGRGGVSHCIEKAELLMHASRVLTLPSHCVFLGVFKAPHSDPPSPSAAQRRSCARWRARRPIVLLHKRETADFWKNSHIQAKLSSPPPPAISPVCG